MGKRNLCGDSSLTASAVAAMKINQAKFRVSPAMLLGLTQEEKTRSFCFFVFFFIT